MPDINPDLSSHVECISVIQKGMSIIINCSFFVVNLHNMPKYRELIEIIDCIDITPKIDETIDVTFDIKGIFKLPYSK